MSAMSGPNALPATTCRVSGKWDQQVEGLSFPSRSAWRIAPGAWLSSSQLGSNCRAAMCRSSFRHPKSWNVAGPALGTVQNSTGDKKNKCREAGKTRALAVAVTENPTSGRMFSTVPLLFADVNLEDIETAKLKLLSEVIETRRGLVTSAEQRAIVEENLVAVEKFDAGKSLELDKLDGTWLLQYTTAPDVIQILQASETPFLKVGQIFQKFECKGRTDGGVVRNVVRWSIPGILQDVDGATLVVTAKFSVVSSRSIALSFEEAQLGQVQISEGLQALLAPAVLPRTLLNLEFLQFFRNLNLRVPLVQSAVRNNIPQSSPVGLWYYLTYLDRDMLVGRALGSGGLFIFSRTQQLELPEL